jgi:hypothetical protein
MNRISNGGVCVLLCVNAVACGTLVPESELPTAAARDLGCDSDIQIHRYFLLGDTSTRITA